MHNEILSGKSLMVVHTITKPEITRTTPITTRLTPRNTPSSPTFVFMGVVNIVASCFA